MAMESLELESSIIGDSEIIQVDFLQEIQQNMLKFQSQLDQLTSKLEQLEDTTAEHQRSCICMNKLSRQESQSQQPSTSTSSASTSRSSSAQQHPEIVRVDGRINTLGNNINMIKHDLRLLASHVMGKSAGVATASARPTGTGTANTSLGAPRLHQQQQYPTKVVNRPPPPLTPATPSIRTNAPSSSTSKVVYDRDQAQDSSSNAMGNDSTTHYNDDDEDENGGSDEYEEDDEDGEDDDDPIMEIEPEIIIGEFDGENEEDYINSYPREDEEEEEDATGYSQEQEEEDSIAYAQDAGDMQQDDYDDSNDYGYEGYDQDQDDDGDGIVQGEGQGVQVEFRDKLGNLIRCVALDTTGYIKCPSCPVHCMSRRNIIRHYNNKHADPKSFECGVCGAILNRKDSLTVHLRNQHNVTEQGGQLVSLGAQPELKPPSVKIQYLCNACGKSFSTPDTLTAHNCPNLNGVESNSQLPENSRKCPLCSKSFTFHKYLLRHLKSHAQVNKCVACGKTYSRRDKLRTHQREKHGRVLDDNFGSISMNRIQNENSGSRNMLQRTF